VRRAPAVDYPLRGLIGGQGTAQPIARARPAALEPGQSNPSIRGPMSDHGTTAYPATQVETPEAFLADRQRFWDGFAHFTLGSVIAIIILLVLMAFFLL
jgi:hypothetical protein